MHTQTRTAEKTETYTRFDAAGWAWVTESRRDAGSESIARGYLNAAEWDAYFSRAPRSRRHWLMGRVAAKDAVRQWRKRHGAEPVHPTEIAILADRHGRPTVSTRDALDVSLSIAHSGDVAVAIVDAEAVGIDVEVAKCHGLGVEAIALSPREQALLRELTAQAKEDSRDTRSRMFLRFWTAKEAVAKARGTGLGGRLSFFAIEAVEEDVLSVFCCEDAKGAGRTYTVRTGTVTAYSPALSRGAEYIVAWTAGKPVHCLS